MSTTMDVKTFQPVTAGIALIPESEIDMRSDEELIEILKHPKPVRHERNVWAFWDTGFDNMRSWTQRNVLGWMRRQGPSWDVRLLDMVPGSLTNVQNFVPPEYLPECFKHGTMDGPAKGQHASDCARLGLLYLHGGVWLDVGSVLFRKFDHIFWQALEDPESPFEMGTTLFQSRKYIGQCITGFLGARKGNPFIQRWMQLWLELWKDGRTNCFGLHEHPLLKPLGLIVPPEEQEHENPRQIDLGGAGGFDLKITTDYLTLNMAYERVRLLVDDAGWNGPEYFRRHVHFLDTIDEIWKSHEMMLQDELFPLLSLPFKPENAETDAKQKEAANYVGYVLANCSMAKHSQGHWQPGLRVPLAMSWSMPENADADIKKGTWAEYVRWASIFCEQDRMKGVCLPSLELPDEQDEIIKGGLLEVK
ncbi:hypothetical protein F5B22DRAFT_470509 [Xylaria bambusicola]|uniref:uncharacterized protein n=1 Tax=Xylaria bambusicola TaxID=326684 RepID=UPI002008C525|nr:uncharacterized protein F5B22DRAFT_470509 [Xylaria bambusicola]KAI0522310.1 hypothetical protein F5B22DRAFT_470509 [Xylaria bambusicola]